jgi:hypothetical protein
MTAGGPVRGCGDRGTRPDRRPDPATGPDRHAVQSAGVMKRAKNVASSS